MPLIPTTERLGSYAVKYSWSGTAPYDVYQDGKLVLDQTSLTQYIAQTTDGTTNPLPAIEILDDTDTVTADSILYSPRVRFQWRGQSDAVLYIVQEYVSGTWTARGSVNEDGRGYYDFETQALADDTTAQWRVLPQDNNGYQGEPLPFSFYVVRNPAPPAVTFSYSAGTSNLTVSAA